MGIGTYFEDKLIQYTFQSSSSLSPSTKEAGKLGVRILYSLAIRVYPWDLDATNHSALEEIWILKLETWGCGLGKKIVLTCTVELEAGSSGIAVVEVVVFICKHAQC